MPLYLRKRVPLTRHVSLNISKTGVSLTARAGRVTVNTHGRKSVRLGKGLTWRSGR